MAPALVELSTSKEINSSSKKYIEDFTCMSHLNLELVEKIRFVDSPLFTQDIKIEKKEVDESFEKENSTTNAMVSNETDTISTNNVNGICNKVCNKEDKFATEKLLKCYLSNENGSKPINGSVNQIEYEKEKLKHCENIASSIATLHEAHPPQPVATYKASNSLTQLLNLKESTVQTNFSRLNSELNLLSDRLSRFCTKDLSSHVACVVSKSNEVLQCNQRNGNYNKDLRDKSDKKQNDNNYVLLKQTFDLVNNSITDDEDILDLKQCPPLKVKRHKSQR